MTEANNKMIKRELKLKRNDCINNSENYSVNNEKCVNNSAKRNNGKKVKSVIPRNRLELLKWNGWGYRDSKFIVKDGVIHFTGTRYPIGEISLPYFTNFVLETFDVDLSHRVEPQPMPQESDYPPAMPCPGFTQAVEALGVAYSCRGEDRLVRAHGHTLHDIYTLRAHGGRFQRIPDLVLWPTSHQEVVNVVRMAQEHDVVIIPFGGGTSVSGSVSCPVRETRPVAALDTSQMNRLLWVDRDNLLVGLEAGIVGQDLERELQELGLTVGHEPDSYEFSSLGGWIATRASGMKKNVYGNIEDLLVKVRMVTPSGVLEKAVQAPRISCGPDFDHMILGSEGTLGVVTEAVLKVRPLPQCKRYGSVVFPNFSAGVSALREVARRRCQPASIRLVDNEQFRFGQALRPAGSWGKTLLEGIKKAYITRFKGFELEHMCVATLLFEGDVEEVKRQEKIIYEITASHGGLAAGETNGERGYLLTFVIAYIRDLGLEYRIVAESFETSVPWSRCESLCQNVKHRVRQECAALGIRHFLISCRVTQTYDAGACVYFYFAFNHAGLANPVAAYEDLESSARDEILASGGSVSHHHGVGKLRSRWYPQSVSETGVGLYLAAKHQLDPTNVFAAGNLVPPATTEKLLSKL